MIAKVVKRGKGGTKATRASAGRLMAYLLGKGDARDGATEAGENSLGNLHAEPRVIAAWDPAAEACWGTACRSVDWGREDAAWASLRRIAAEIAGDAAAGVAIDRGGKDHNLVWHTVLAAHPDDRGEDGQPKLGDAQWAAIARRLMAETGLDSRDGGGVRWVAVRHGLNNAGADHIHVMAVLIREDGTRASTHNDAFAAQRTARWAEQEYGLVPGRGRSRPDAQPQGGRRGDRPAGRDEQTAAAKAGPPYPRPTGISDELWRWLQKEGTERSWTRQGLARGAVLCAAARAVSPEHLVQLIEEQGYRVQLRYRKDDPARIAGWTITDPGGCRGARAPKTYAGGRLGSDCSWPAIIRHLDAKNRHLSPGRGTIAAAEEDAMLTRDRMAAAGWGPEFIARVIDADRALAEGGDPAIAYWLRDAVWQIAWEAEGSKGKHGVWTDAAYLYSAVAAGGVPQPPREMLTALAEVRGQIEEVLRRKGDMLAALDERDRRADWWSSTASAAGRRADSVPRGAVMPPPWFAFAPKAMAGVALLQIAEATHRVEAANAVRREASAARERARVELRAIADENRRQQAEAVELNQWLRQARTYERAVEAELARHRQAVQQWRDAIGGLLVDARVHGDGEAGERVVAIDAAYGPNGEPGVAVGSRLR